MGLIYIIFQTQNAMVDSWYYSACVKFKSELFNSHHLIYNYLGYYWFSLLKIFLPNVEAIVALNLMNAIAAITCLYLINSCLLKLKVNSTNALWLSLFCGVSFGFMRYATDAETYILPIVFSLASTQLFINPKNSTPLFFSGLLGALSIMFHQVHIWWTLSMFISLLVSKPFNFRKILAFSLPLLSIPMVYWLVFNNSHKTTGFIQFLLGEYSKGNAGIDLSLKALLLTCINLLRTFFQIHGNIVVLFKSYWLPLSVSIISIFIVLLFGIKKQNFKSIIPIEKTAHKTLFLLAFLLHFLFAFISSGNAEFMVMLPFLLVLYVASTYQINQLVFLKNLTISLLIWNLTVAIIPNSFLNINRVDKQVAISLDHQNHYTLWRNKPLVENQITYKMGFSNTYNTLLSLKLIDTQIIDSILLKYQIIYTDLPNTNGILSREKIISGENELKLLLNYQLNKCDSFDNFYGKNYIYSIQKRAD